MSDAAKSAAEGIDKVTSAVSKFLGQANVNVALNIITLAAVGYTVYFIYDRLAPFVGALGEGLDESAEAFGYFTSEAGDLGVASAQEKYDLAVTMGWINPSTGELTIAGNAAFADGSMKAAYNEIGF